ncbi:pentatricopeptide repeat-containing protein at2g42920 chloroplastic [Phtheirospermum japonicum]|uniref:Pentatricopeptide repeat-containing protein at2g42920 chloroplastic n=1 Tax=Phtheirospermum japonicum TaxID=374723 RepID=A0A830BM31_9LAMI|nr:pentatricopeptide repeat-containing protein at2g42920 chloroplastic [Phtheirospermum japonicum]
MLETNCHSITDLKKIHTHLIKTGLSRDTIAASRVLAFCATSSSAPDLDYAYSVFRQIEKPNLFTWNTIIRGFCQSSYPHVAIQLFVEMLVTSPVRPERLTYPSVFKAFTQLGLAEDGAQLHGRIVKLGLDSDPFIRNSIIHMYANCGLLGNAKKLFDENEDSDVVAWNSMVMGFAKCGQVDESWRLFVKTPSKNATSWNTMISGYVRNGKWVEALDLFREMRAEKIKPSEFTLVSVLNACSKLGALEQGKWIHEYIERHDIESNVIVITSIIDMYCKCGDVQSAGRVFKATPRKGLSSWNSMILGLATNGFESEAFKLFSELDKSSNLRLDSVSFIAILTACNHSLRVDKAREYFKVMSENYGIEPNIKHYGCMVDVLGRDGRIEEAAELVRNMPMRPDGVIWGSLLSACKNHRNVGVAEWAARNLILSDPDETSAYVMLSNVYAVSGDFKRAVRERVRMKEKMVGKQPGCSLIEVNGEVHEFVS